MTTETPTPLEDRIRRGLRGAADAVPDRSTVPSMPTRPVDRRRPVVRPWPLAAALAAVAAVTVAVAAVVTTGDDDPAADDVRSASASETTTATAAPPPTSTTVVPRPTNGQSPGRVVVDPVASVLRTFDENGVETGQRSLAPLESLQSVVSDLDGGYVACGLVPGEPLSPEELAEMPGATPGRQDQIMWFPAEGEPQVVDRDRLPVTCMADSLQVVDSPQGAMVVLSPGFPPDTTWRGYVIATGEIVPLAASTGPLPGHWAAATGTVITYVEGTGLTRHDLYTGAAIPSAPIALEGSPSSMRLAPDGRSVAVLSGPVMGPLSLDVYDLDSGEVLLHHPFDGSAEGDELSYDGTTVAYGNYYDDRMPVTVIDVATGTTRTVDAFGLLL
jgi:hypothetical protein